MLSKCCCCIELRTGCIILGVLGILTGFSLITKGPYDSLYIIGAIFYVLRVSTEYLPLLFGAIKFNQRALLVSLVAGFLLTVLGVVYLIIVMAIVDIETLAPKLANGCRGVEDFHQLGMSCEDFKSMVKITTASILLAGGALEIYFLLCVYSFYKELKTGSLSLPK
jgi:hypothetical protein